MIKVILFCLFSMLPMAECVANHNSKSSDSEPDFDLESISLEELMYVQIEISSNREETLLNSVSVVSVLDSHQIKQFGFTSLEDALGTVAGFDVIRTYFVKSIPASRGVLPEHYANKILFMVNGVPSWGGVYGDPILWRIDINDIDSIEVLKGPASVLYGTNAYSGAVNIKLKSKTGRSVSLGVGSDNLYSAGFRYSTTYADGHTHVYINTSQTSKKDYNFIDESTVQGVVTDYLKADSITLDVGYKNHNLLANYYSGEEGFFGIVPLYSAGAGIPHQKDGWFVNYNWNLDIADDKELSFTATYDENDRTAASAANNDTIVIADGFRTQLGINYLQEFSEKFNLEIGLEFDEKTVDYNHFVDSETGMVTSGVIQQGESIYERSLYSQFSYQGDDESWILGARYVSNQLFGANVSLRGTYVQMLSPTTSLKYIIGESFRSPSLFETHAFVFSGNIQGRKDLNPEEALTYEISLVHSSGPFLMQATAYHAEYKNKIFRALRENYVGSDGTVFPVTNVYENGSPFQANGLEVEFKYSIDNGIHLFSNLSYINGSDGDKFSGSDDHNFKYVPKTSASVGISRRVVNWNFSGKINYHSSSEGPEETIEASTLVDLSGLYQQHLENGISLNHRLSVENLFDDKFLFAEYARRRGLNDVPVNFGRTFSYRLSFMF